MNVVVVVVKGTDAPECGTRNDRPARKGAAVVARQL
jgi:hypothetical protein